MLCKVSPTHKVLVRYLQNIDTSDQNGVLLDVATPLKKKKVSKKDAKGSSSLKVQDETNPTEETLSKSKKELIPSKSGVLKKIRKAEVNSKGVTICSIPTPVSPGKKRQRAEDVAKNMQRTLVKRRKMVIHNESSDEEIVPENPPVTSMKLKAIIQTQADSGRISSISAMEVDVMIKGAEKRIMEKVDQTDKNNELRIKAQGSNFTSVVQDLKAATKECHILFVQDVKKVREDVNFKIHELKSELAKDLQDIHTKHADVQKQIVEVSSKLQKFINVPVLEAHKEETKEKFDQLTKLVTELKTTVSHSSSTQILTPKFLSLKITTLEQAIQKALAPLTNFTSLLPKSAAPVFTGVQGGEKSRSKEEEAKTVGKVISTQLIATLPIPTKPISSTTITTKTVSKGIVIEENEGGSSSKPQTDVHMEENNLKGSETDVFKVGFAHVKTFIDNYFDCLALKDDELANVLGREVKVRWEETLSQSALSKYVVGEICLKPFGMVFSGRDTKGKPKKFLFKVSEIERYNSSQYMHFIGLRLEVEERLFATNISSLLIL
ncbi:uncharacterized protein LOC111883500 [Lactuca sativa]|uniref:uncharacterized protein LOC111883500 n=1 Tax=Lactuca sativa TaxID=4236 RepID=UPI0022AF0905|nr:uncharacterized protein LOC111883500 [Lactuca sativa]